MDTLTPGQRSELMRRVRSRDTRPELRVRRLAHSLGYRYRLHRRELPGSPDLVFPGRRSVMFVHGCFWHRHPGCRNTRTPKSRVDFWTRKFADNVTRDERNQTELRDLGWRHLVIWECETVNTAELSRRIIEFLEGK